MPAYDADVFERAVAEIAAGLDGADLRRTESMRDLDPGEHPDNLRAGAFVTPRSTAQVAAIVGICCRHGISIVPQGGRTGLVGGGISAPGQVVLSLQKMNRVEEIDPIEGVAVVEAGVTLQVLQEAGLAHGLEPGIDLAARGSATVGGMVSTNAGGMVAFRNGVMRHRILGLEAVLPDGSVYCDMTRVVKNSAGYDLKHLFIGAEGTLGIVTRLVIKLEPVPAASVTAIFGLPSTAAALDLMRRARATGKLQAAEVLWSRYFKFTAAHFGWSAPDYDRDSQVHLIMGVGGQDEAELQTVVTDLFEAVLDLYPETTAVLASSSQQAKEIWRLREETGLIYRDYPAAPSYDISVPLGRLDEFLAERLPKLEELEPGLSPFVFGHLADGNLHLAIDRPGAWLTEERRDAVEAILYDGIGAIGGSFSAEHGVGSKRIHALNATADPVKLKLMAVIKQALDPQNILNPGKLFLSGE